MSEGLGIGEIVDGDEVEVLIGERGAKNVASDASKSINANFYGHGASERNFACLTKNAQPPKTTLDGNRLEEPA
jgi:hypothetical protein